MECLAPWNGLAMTRWEVATDEEKESVLARTPHWSVHMGKCAGAKVALYSCRSTPLKLKLWTASLDTVQQFVAPYAHPNIVQFLGVATSADQSDSIALPPNEGIIMEYLPVSLYDVLHRDHIMLSRREIALTAIQVLQGLLFLHRKQQSLGVCLTSKKVMLDGSNRIKLRRFGLEMVIRSGKAPSHLSSPVLKTVYEMAEPKPPMKIPLVASPGSLPPLRPSSPGSSQPINEPKLMSITQDLFAFGVMLLEMCTREKPTIELFNRMSCAKQIDPVFGRVLQLTLPLGDVIVLEDSLQKPKRVTAEDLLHVLITNEQQRAGEELRLSSSSFPCFLFADRYFEKKEAEQIERKLQERQRREDSDLKRLAVVEQELVHEQKSFSILALQLERVQNEKAHELEKQSRLQAQLSALEQSKCDSDNAIKHLMMEAEEQSKQVMVLQSLLEREREKTEILQIAKSSDTEEKQSLRLKILKLEEEKLSLANKKDEVEAERTAIAHKLGSDKEALSDIEGRLAQAIYHLEEEQRMRRKAERQAEATSRQLLRMEEERCNYTSVLLQSPTGQLAPNASLFYVLALKDKEVNELDRHLQQSRDCQTLLRSDIARLEASYCEVMTQKESLLMEYGNAQTKLLLLSAQVVEQEGVVGKLHKQLLDSTTETKALKSKLAAVEKKAERQAKEEVDEEAKRQLRQCLTPQCDAPRYLVGTSGYCKECEERTDAKQRCRRHCDDVRSRGHDVRKNVKNISVMKLVRVLEASDESRTEDMNQQHLHGALKQLSALLKSDEALKDDLPECLAIKSILALMHRHRSSFILQLECCKCLSVVVFNHARNRFIVVAEGGVHSVLGAMKSFQSEAKMLEASCVLLTNLAHNCEINRRRITDAGGIDAVLEAMQTFPKHCGVQKRSCWALLTLAGSDVMCDSIAMRGGLGAIIAAMLNCPANEHVQFYGSWALVNLLSGTERLRAFARREGVREVAETARACFPEHKGIHEKTIEILQLLV